MQVLSGFDVADHLAGDPDILARHVPLNLRPFFHRHVAQDNQIADKGARQRPVVLGMDISGDDGAGIDGIR